MNASPAYLANCICLKNDFLLFFRYLESLEYDSIPAKMICLVLWSKIGRYACLLAPADIMFCTIIREFGKQRDLVSALEAFEASKQKMNGHNMYAYRTIIDVCGRCGDFFKSRSIFEVLLQTDISGYFF